MMFVVMLSLLHLHIASTTSLSWYWLWHPLFGPGYQFYSGVGANFGELTIFGFAIAFLKHLDCDTPRCLRYGPHRTADGQHKLCRHHHPDLPNHKLSLKEIHERHHLTKERHEHH